MSEGPAAGSASKFASLVLAAIVSWLLVQWVDLDSADIADLRLTTLLAQDLTVSNVSAVKGDQFKPITDPFRLGSRFAVVRIEFDLPARPSDEMAVFIKRARDNYAVYINGQLAAPTPGVLGEHPTYHGIEPRLVTILPGLMRQGANTIDILCARNMKSVYMREVYFGPRARLEPAFEHSRTILHDIPLYAAIAAGLVLLFALALSSLIRKPALMLTIALTLGFFLGRELHTLWVDVAWPGNVRDAYGILVSVGLWLSVSAFVNEWTGAVARWRTAAVAAGALAWVLILGFFIFLPSPASYLAASWVEVAVVTIALPFMGQRMIRFYAREPATAIAESASFAIAFILGVFTFVTQLGIDFQFSASLPIHSQAFSRFASIAMICGIAIGLARYGVGLYHLAQLNNQTLAERVRQKELELETNHALMREQEREHAAQTERSRIMRDVHDGIGSQLLGLLLQARADRLKGDALTGGLQSALDDLHLVVDSLDQVEGPLETALGAFRNRIAPKCSAAGVAVDWNVEGVGDAPAVGPAGVLQIYRILQEACTNALKHAKPTRLAFKLCRSQAEPGRIEISVRDDGTGFDGQTSPRSGRGLANMKRRAASIGGRLDIDSGATGTCVRLLI